MKQKQRYGFYVLLALFAFQWMGCDRNNPDPGPDPNPNPETPVELVLTASRTAIKANGRDTVRFTITADGQELTSSYSLLMKGDTVPLKNDYFLTDTAASYTFYAIYQDATSNEIVVEAATVAVSLSASADRIKANNREAVHFSVLSEGNDVTQSAVINCVGGSSATLDADSFKTKEAGVYRFYATYDGGRSDTVKVEAEAITVAFSAVKETIKANGDDQTSFIVTADGEQVTSEAAIYLKSSGGDILLENNIFRTDEAGNYTFYAEYDGLKSNEVRLSATSVKYSFYKHHLIMQFTSTICPNCPRLEQTITSVVQDKPEVYHLSFHLFSDREGQCRSALGGAIYDIANDLCPEEGFPRATVDLNYDYNYIIRNYNTTKIAEVLTTLTTKYPALTGIAVNSKVQNGVIDFTIKVKPSKTGNYAIYAFIVEDNLLYRQLLPDYDDTPLGYVANDAYPHKNVATYALPEGDPRTGVSLGSIKEGKQEERSYSIDTKTIDLNQVNPSVIKRPPVNFANCRIIAYTLRQIDGKMYMDNVVSCPVNGELPFIYEEL